VIFQIGLHPFQGGMGAIHRFPPIFTKTERKEHINTPILQKTPLGYALFM